MPAPHSQQDLAPHVLVVIVLYRMSPQASPAFQSLLRVAAELAAPIACVIHDNSPSAHQLPETPFPCLYSHHPRNPGLAEAYQQAFEHAQREAFSWLLTLDQDTVLTNAFMTELLETARDLNAQRSVGAIVPKLVQDGMVLSPHWPHGYRSTRGFLDRSGLLEPDVRVYNSGALLRVEAVRAIGGFPSDFPLDYLDHAVFARLHAHSYRTFLLHSSLQHQLDSKSQDICTALKSSSRLRGTMAAETRFYRQYGGVRDRLLLLRRRAKLALRMLSRMEFRSLAALIRCTVFATDRPLTPLRNPGNPLD